MQRDSPFERRPAKRSAERTFRPNYISFAGTYQCKHSLTRYTATVTVVLP